LASVEPEFRPGFDASELPPSAVLALAGTGLGVEGGDGKRERTPVGRDISAAAGLRPAVAMTPPGRGLPGERDTFKTQGSGYGPHHGGHIHAAG